MPTTLSKKISGLLKATKDTEWRHTRESDQLDESDGSFFFGESDAQSEWTDESTATVQFVHTASYTKFLKPRILAVYGRRGTGKSTLINMLRYEVRLGKNKDYDHCWVVDDEKPHFALVSHLRRYDHLDHPDNEVVLQFTSAWLWLIRVSAMQGVLWTHASEGYEGPPLPDSVIEFLARRDFCDKHREPTSRSPIDDITTVLMNEGDVERGFSYSIQHSLELLCDSSYRQALRDFTDFLAGQEEQSLVMIDSIEEYPIHDSLWRLSLLGLYEATKEIFKGAKKKRILVKLAFPSELRPHVQPIARDKFEKHELFIMWRHRDLTEMLANRMRVGIGKQQESDLGSHSSKSLGYESALAELYRYLPKTMKNRLGQRVDTISYIVKHTQKRPRQLVKMMNGVIDSALADLDIEEVHESSIVERSVDRGVHGVLVSLAKDAILKYDEIFKEGGEIARKMLARQANIFLWKEFDKLVKSVHAIRREHNYSRENIKRLLLESGIVGRVSSIGQYGDYHYINVEYEYQIKRTLEPTDEDFVAIHPMFYEYYDTRVHPKIIPFPHPSDEEEKLIIEAAIALSSNTGDEASGS